MSSRDPVPGRRSSRPIFFAVITKRAAAMPTIAMPRTISASPAMLPNFWPGNDRVRPAKEEPPQHLGSHELEGQERLDFLVHHPETWLGIECKNIREWLYP